MRSEVIVNKGGWISMRLGRENAGTRFMTERLADGTIILRPAVLVTPAEARALENPAAQRAAAGHETGGVAFGSAELPET